MKSVGHNKLLLLSTLHTIGSQEYLIEYFRFKTKNPIKDKETYFGIPGYDNIEEPVKRLLEILPNLKDEFENVMHSYNDLNKQLYFNNIKRDLLSTIDISKEAALKVINQHNHFALEEFAFKIKDAEDDFFSHPDREYGHLERFTKVTPSYYSPITGGLIPAKTNNIFNKNYYEVTIEADLIDSKYLEKYLGLITLVKDAIIYELWSTIDIYQSHLAITVKQDTLTITQSSSQNKKQLSTIGDVHPRINEQHLEDKKLQSLKHINFLAGYNISGARIMPEFDFKRLYDYTLHLISKKEIPIDIDPIYLVGMQKGHIRYAFYLVSVTMYGSRHNEKKLYVDFLYKVFPNHFNEPEVAWNTTYTKFSTKPRTWDFDLKTMNGKIGK
ncbi:hypothetical protein H8S95_01045 [Pontibacter sp. KCTC 32443]|uniref:hypothetical protein n=1 Tax=Pontibacter TaxID=323449 RepID=UPI00164E6F45|nr:MULTISPECIES: hypothetical protein [Pontibacter]MBC5772633.1 hypothetical protein [Pontibacter sp. KCTC 32443]